MRRMWGTSMSILVTKMSFIWPNHVFRAIDRRRRRCCWWPYRRRVCYCDLFIWVSKELQKFYEKRIQSTMLWRVAFSTAHWNDGKYGILINRCHSNDPAWATSARLTPAVFNLVTSPVSFVMMSWSHLHVDTDTYKSLPYFCRSIRMTISPPADACTFSYSRNVHLL